MANKKRRSRFDREVVVHHAARHYPNCPAEMVALRMTSAWVNGIRL
jgi:hypothetical protein